MSGLQLLTVGLVPAKSSEFVGCTKFSQCSNLRLPESRSVQWGVFSHSWTHFSPAAISTSGQLREGSKRGRGVWCRAVEVEKLPEVDGTSTLKDLEVRLPAYCPFRTLILVVWLCPSQTLHTWIWQCYLTCDVFTSVCAV